MESEKGQGPEHDEVGGQERSFGRSHASVLPLSGADRTLVAKLIAAGTLSSLAVWLVVYRTGAEGPDIAAVASSPLFYLGVTTCCVASLWAAQLVEHRPAGGSTVPFVVVLGAALVMRIIALPADPGLSDDIYRYLWDGHVQAEGINPYLHPPAAPELDAIATPWRGLINNPDLPTIYPPLSQMVFFVAAIPGGGIVGMKALILLFDLGTILALSAILRHASREPARVVIYAWSPLAVIEVAWNGHQDPIGVCLLALAALGIIKGRRWLSTAAAALSGAARYVGWLVLPLIARRSGPRVLLAAPAILVAVYLPFLSAGAGVVGSLADYAVRWRFNDSLFSLVAAGVERTGLSPAARSLLVSWEILDPEARWESSLILRLTDPPFLSRCIAAGIFLAFAIRVLRRPWEDPLRSLLALIGAALLLSPTLHPWYLLWVAPLMAIVPRMSWIWLTWAALALSYPLAAAGAGAEGAAGWLRLAEYAPFFVILGVESARRRLWEMDGDGWARIV